MVGLIQPLFCWNPFFLANAVIKYMSSRLLPLVDCVFMYESQDPLSETVNSVEHKNTSQTQVVEKYLASSVV